MTEAGHRQAVAELRVSRARLTPAEDIRAYTEVSFGLAFHLLAIGSERRWRTHREHHEGLSRWLRQQGEPEVGGALQELENFRLGRWYGRQGNGNAAAAIDQLVARIEAWALAERSS